MSEQESRYSTVTRRAFLGGLSMAAIAGVVGCSAATSSSAPATSAAGTTSSTPSATGGSSASSSGKTLPTSAKAVITWTFTSSGGMGRNPYMAVWIEDASGNFVKTVALYHRANGDNWLSELTNWYQSSGATDTTTSGTVPAGTYSANWDGTTAAGARATQGSYYVCVESVVEHGSDSLVRQQVDFGAKASATTLTASGEITAAAVAYTV